LIRSDVLLGLPDYEVTAVDEVAGQIRVQVRFTGSIACPHCGGEKLRLKDRRIRRPRHENLGLRHSALEVETRKWLCRACNRSFWQRLPGIQPRMRATEPFRRSVCQKHFDGISRSRLGVRERISSATVERWFVGWYLPLLVGERISRACPRALGIDEHFFTRRHGYATTLCDLKGHKVFDLALGRSEASLEQHFDGLEGKDDVDLVCIDLSSAYRALVRKHFPNARIVADRFHVIRLVNQQFLACWKEIDPAGAKNRGLLSLMRRHRHHLSVPQHERLSAYLRQRPVLERIYAFKQRLCYLLLEKARNQKRCQKLARRFLRDVAALRCCGLAPLEQLGNTLYAWREEIACMWRFTRNNGITEGFHTKMEVLQRQAYGFRNFQNYRLRVKVMCS
jgi:transposase